MTPEYITESIKSDLISQGFNVMNVIIDDSWKDDDQVRVLFTFVTTNLVGTSYCEAFFDTETEFLIDMTI